MGARPGRVVTTAVRSPVSPATRWIRVLSIASARVIVGRMLVREHASVEVPTPGLSYMSRFETQCFIDTSFELTTIAPGPHCWLSKTGVARRTTAAVAAGADEKNINVALGRAVVRAIAPPA